MTTTAVFDLSRNGEATTWADLTPAAVLPAQLTSAFRFDAALQPEKRLMLAVLEDAVGTYQKRAVAAAPAGRREFLEAQLDRDALRGGLRSWRERQRTLPPAQRLVVRHPFRRTNGSRTRTRGRAAGIRIFD